MESQELQLSQTDHTSVWAIAAAFGVGKGRPTKFPN